MKKLSFYMILIGFTVIISSQLDCSEKSSGFLEEIQKGFKLKKTKSPELIDAERRLKDKFITQDEFDEIKKEIEEKEKTKVTTKPSTTTTTTTSSPQKPPIKKTTVKKPETLENSLEELATALSSLSGPKKSPTTPSKPPEGKKPSTMLPPSKNIPITKTHEKIGGKWVEIKTTTPAPEKKSFVYEKAVDIPDLSILNITVGEAKMKSGSYAAIAKAKGLGVLKAAKIEAHLAKKDESLTVEEALKDFTA